MKCPKCGQELTISKKYPSYALCYNCRKKYKLPEKYYKQDEEYEDEYEDNADGLYADDYGHKKGYGSEYDGYGDDDDYDDDDYDDDGYDDDDDYDDRPRRHGRASGNAAKSGPSGRYQHAPKKKKKSHGFLKFLLILIILIIILGAAVLGLYKFDLLPGPIADIVDTFVTDHLDFLANSDSEDSGEVEEAEIVDSGEGGSAAISASFEQLLQYMQESGTVSGEPSDAYADVIGALNGCKFADSNVEIYEFDTSSDRYTEASENAQVGGMEVAAVNGPFVLIFSTEDQSSDIINAFMNYKVE